MKKITLLIILIHQLLFTQVNFSEANKLIDRTVSSNLVTSMVSVDLNNNGFNEIVIGSYYDNKIHFYKNINGNIQHFQREILTYDPDGSYYSNFNIFPKDLNNDGLVDLLVTNEFKNTTSWYENLGDYKFSNEIIIDNSLKKPTSVVAEDIDKDGDIDIIVGSEDEVILFDNSGNNSFLSKKVLFNNNYGSSKLLLKDLNNNGFLDVINGEPSGSIYWIKNIDGINFSDKIFAAQTSGDGYEFDFLDINNDSYLDLFFVSHYDDHISYRLNEQGSSFSNNNIVVGDKVEDIYNIKILDFNKDGKNDIIATTKSSGKIGWFKQEDVSEFSNFIEISNNVSSVKHFILKDLTQNGNLEIITASNNKNLISKFEIDPSTNIYQKTLIQFPMSPAFVVKIQDLDNDGKNDIISGFNSVVYNKNYGDNIFSSQILISESIGNLVTDIEFFDFDQDGFIDIVAGRQDKLEFYKNNNGTKFSLEKIITIEYFVEEIELKDVDSDGIEDLLIAHNSGFYPLSKIINKLNFNFENIAPIYESNYGYYKDFSFKSADVDNDGDNDIIVGEKDKSILKFFRNDGLGNFAESIIASSVYCSDIDLGDIDNNGTIDIVVSGDNDYSQNSLNIFMSSISNNQNNPVFNKIFIDQQSLQSIVLGDINNDSYLDIVGTVYHPSGDGDQILYYLFNGNQFENQVAIESPGNLGSLDKNASLGDLNNDGKLDIISTDYLNSTVKYFINSSTLSIDKITDNKNSYFNIYPNPSSGYINWNSELNFSEIQIYNTIGKEVHKINKINPISASLNISFLNKGVYYLKAETNDGSNYFTKLIIK
ncbi:FG-GAP-like repeat-containing protein [Polaribacter sp. Asnod6-C07]|uniref:FG-GAP-like repeat-containing protein n=1 Tax=Polaribacter sp. Asnod6-C07 TaxID=3160582 RepID=UPI003864026A